jgi:hypothetical protein
VRAHSTVLACLRLMVEDQMTLDTMNQLDMTLKSQLLTAIFKISMGSDPTVVDQAQVMLLVRPWCYTCHHPTLSPRA